MSDKDFRDEFSPNKQGITCPECGSSFEYVGHQYGTGGSYDLYYCERNVELQQMRHPQEVVGNEEDYCHGIVHVWASGRVSVSSTNHNREFRPADE